MLAWLVAAPSLCSGGQYLCMTSQPKKLFEKGVTVDYESCNHGFRNYDSDDSDGDGIDNRNDDDDDGDGIPDDHEFDHYPGDYDEECFRKDLEGMESIQTKLGPFGSLVESCCEFDGYVEIGECRGTDKEGNDLRLQNLKVCHDHLSNKTIHHPAGKILEIIKDCPRNCHYESGFLNDLSQISVEGEKAMLTTSRLNITTGDFCLAYACNYDNQDTGLWDVMYEACVCPPLNCSRSEKPQCCGADGLISWDRQGTEKIKCELREMNQSAQGQTAFTQKENVLDQCGDWRTRERKVILKQDDPLYDDATCVSMINDGREASCGGVVCKKACDGAEACIVSCHKDQRVWDGFGYLHVNGTNRTSRLSEITGLNLTDLNIEDDVGMMDDWMIRCDLQDFYQKENNEDIFLNKVDFEKDGSVVFPNRGNYTLNYREFCISLIHETETKDRGEFMIRGCLPKFDKEEVQFIESKKSNNSDVSVKEEDYVSDQTLSDKLGDDIED